MSTPEQDYPIRACAWPPRPAPREGSVRLITREEFVSWIVYEDDRLLVVSKPGDVVCHPSKAGPWSSLVGAAREYTGLPVMYLVFRLDRETSGIIVMAKDSQTAGQLQRAMQDRRVHKEYLAILCGVLPGAVTVHQPLGPDTSSPVFIKTCVTAGDGSKPSVTHFSPLVAGAGFCLVHADLETGRKHQIRAHAAWLGYPVVGDKIYGPDDRCYLDFIDRGWTPELESKLLLPRQALHCTRIDLGGAIYPSVFSAKLPDDLRAFCAGRIEIPDGI